MEWRHMRAGRYFWTANICNCCHQNLTGVKSTIHWQTGTSLYSIVLVDIYLPGWAAPATP